MSTSSCFTYYAFANALVCKQCRTGVFASEECVKNHLGKYHDMWTAAACKSVLALSPAAAVAADGANAHPFAAYYHDAALHASRFVPLARVPFVDTHVGLRCPECPHVCLNTRLLNRHRKAAGHQSNRDKPQPVTIQALFKYKVRRFFHAVDDGSDGPRLCAGGDEPADELDAMLERYYAAPCETDERASAPFIAWNRPWDRLENVGLDKAFAAELSGVPAGEQCALLKVTAPLLRDAIDAFFRLSRVTTRTRTTEMSEFMTLIVSTPGTIGKNKAFKHCENDEPYVRHIVRFFLFLIRMHLAHANGAEGVDGVPQLAPEVHWMVHDLLEGVWANMEPGSNPPGAAAAAGNGENAEHDCYLGCPDCKRFVGAELASRADSKPGSNTPGLVASRCRRGLSASRADSEPGSKSPGSDSAWRRRCAMQVELRRSCAGSSQVLMNSAEFRTNCLSAGFNTPIFPGESNELDEEDMLDWKDAAVRSIFAILRFVYLQPLSVKAEDRRSPSVAYLYVTCLMAVRDHGRVRFALGRDISQPIAAVVHCASLMAILHIFVWPDRTGGENEQMAGYRKLYQPGELIGLGPLVSMLRKCKQTRDLENSVPTWMPCPELGSSEEHKTCGLVNGEHFSPAQVGDTAVKIQTAMWEKLVGPNGVFDHNEINDGFLEMLEKCCDDPQDRTPNFCFMEDVRKHVFRLRARNIVKHWLNRFREKAKEGAHRTKVARDVLLRIRKISQLLQTLLYVTGGACGRGTEMAEFSVRNTETNPLRSFFFMAGKMVSMPTHTKLTWNQFLTLRTVSRHPDRVTALLYKLFVSIAMPVRAVLQQIDHLAANGVLPDDDAKTSKLIGHQFLCGSQKEKEALPDEITTNLIAFGMPSGIRGFRQGSSGVLRLLAAENASVKFLVERAHIQRQDGKDADEAVDEQVETFANQFGHTLATDRKHYGVEIGALLNFGVGTESDIVKFMRATEQYHRALGIEGNTLSKISSLSEKLRESDLVVVLEDITQEDQDYAMHDNEEDDMHECQQQSEYVLETHESHDSEDETPGAVVPNTRTRETEKLGEEDEETTHASRPETTGEEGDADCENEKTVGNALNPYTLDRASQERLEQLGNALASYKALLNNPDDSDSSDDSCDESSDDEAVAEVGAADDCSNDDDARAEMEPAPNPPAVPEDPEDMKNVKKHIRHEAPTSLAGNSANEGYSIPPDDDEEEVLDGESNAIDGDDREDHDDPDEARAVLEPAPETPATTDGSHHRMEIADDYVPVDDGDQVEMRAILEPASKPPADADGFPKRMPGMETVPDVLGGVVDDDDQVHKQPSEARAVSEPASKPPASMAVEKAASSRAKHSTHVAVGVKRGFVPDMMQVPRTKRRLFDSGNELSDEQVPEPETQRRRHQRVAVTDMVDEVEPSPFTETEAQVALRALRLGVGAREDDERVQFRSKLQEEVMHHILNRSEDVLVVDRTGGGKTALVLGPVHTQGGVTAYLVPLRALRADLERRCRESNVPIFSIHEIGFGKNIADMTKGVLFLSPEELENDREKVMVTLNLLASLQRLRRIVVDEVHIIWLSENFRGCMFAIQNLRPPGTTNALSRVPLVLMSATVPLVYECDVVRCCRMDMKNLRVFRGCLRRENVAISVSMPPRMASSSARITNDDTLKHLSSVFKKEKSQNGRHIIFTQSRESVNKFDLEESNGRPFPWRGHVELLRYHAKMSVETKEEALAAWNAEYQKGKPFKVIVCTSAFGTGVDAPDVRSVTIVGMARSLLELAQVLGRVGRDGKPGLLHVVYSRYWQNVCSQNGKLAGVEADLLAETVDWITDSSTCRAMRLDRYLGSLGDNAPCGERSGTVAFCDACATMARIGGGLAARESSLQKKPKSSFAGTRASTLRPLSGDDVTAGQEIVSPVQSKTAMQATPTLRRREYVSSNRGEYDYGVNGVRQPVVSLQEQQQRCGNGSGERQGPRTPQKSMCLSMRGEAGSPPALTPPPRRLSPGSHVTGIINMRSPTRAEKERKVSRLRRIAKAVKEHCGPCMLNGGAAAASADSLLVGGTTRHSFKCYDRCCMKCHSPDHFSRDCRVMIKARKDRCFACALKTIENERCHKHAGTPLNEFGNRDLCIFPSLMSLAVGYLRKPGVLEELVRAEVVPSHLARGDIEAMMMWLVADLSSSPPGILALADAMVEHFKLDLSPHNDD